MKKLVISLICVLIIAYIAIVPTAKAADGVTANITFSGSYTEDTVVININAGKFTGFEAGGVVNASMTLDYDSSIVTKVEAETYDNWKVDLTESTKRMLISTDKSQDNIQIAKVTFHLNKENLKAEEQTIAIKEFQIANGSELNETYPEYSYKFTPEESTPTEPEQNQTENQNGITGTNNITQNNSINTIQGNKTDSTVAKTKLPAAGMGKAIAVAILGIVVLAIIFKIKSRKIKY